MDHLENSFLSLPQLVQDENLAPVTWVQLQSHSWLVVCEIVSFLVWDPPIVRVETVACDEPTPHAQKGCMQDLHRQPEGECYGEVFVDARPWRSWCGR